MIGGSFQTAVRTVPAPAVEGDFASTNPRFNVLAGPGALICGDDGVTIARFAWCSYEGIDPNNAPAIVNNYGSGPVSGFVHREQQGLITDFLAGAGMKIPAGFGVTLFSGGDFWVINRGSTAATIGMKAYANNANGEVSFGLTGAPGTGSVTGSIGPQTTAFTGEINGNVLTVSAAGPQPIVAGALLTGTVGGSGVIANTRIVGQLSGTTGGVGTYALSIPNQEVGSGTLTATYGIMNVTAVSSGTLAVGDQVTGTAGVTTTSISQLGTGSGGTGTYYVGITQTAASQTLTIGQTVETKWVAMSAGAPGELVKISDHPLG